MTSRRTCLVSDWNSLICGCVSVVMIVCILARRASAGMHGAVTADFKPDEAQPARIRAAPPRSGPAGAWIEMQLALHALVRLAGCGAVRSRRDQLDDDDLVPVRTRGHAAAAQSQLLAALRARRNGELDNPAERRHRHLRAERRLPGGKRQLDLHVLAAQQVQGMRQHLDAKDERRVPRAAADAQCLAVADAGGDLHVHLARSAALVDGDAAFGAGERFLDRDLDDPRIGLGLATPETGAARGRPTRGESARAARAGAACAAEQAREEVAESVEVREPLAPRLAEVLLPVGRRPE